MSRKRARPFRDEAQALDHLLVDDRSRSAADGLIESDDLGRIFGRIDELDAREAKVVRMRFGLGAHGPMTLHDFGEQLGLTRERVRQLERQAMRKLIGVLREAGDPVTS